MNKDNNIYVSLDEAREEIKKRWNDTGLKKAVEEELGENLIPIFKEEPRSVIWRSMMTPDNGFDFFNSCSHYINCKATPLEYLQDKFVTINPEKKALSKIRLLDKNDEKKYVQIVANEGQEGKQLVDVTTEFKNNLKDFHENLFRIFYPAVSLVDISDWCKKNGPARNYYYFYLLHFLCHGVLFETFDTEDSKENTFTQKVILPALNKIKSKFKIKSLVVRLYPEDQTEEEDFYWFCYNESINKYLLCLAMDNNLPLKDFK